MPYKSTTNIATATGPQAAGKGGEGSRPRPQLRRCESRCFSAVEQADSDEMVFTLRLPDLAMPGRPLSPLLNSHHPSRRLARAKTWTGTGAASANALAALAATDRIGEHERTRLAQDRTREWLRGVGARLAGEPLGPEFGVAAVAVMELEAGRRGEEARDDGGRKGEEEWWEDVGAVLKECSESVLDPGDAW
ncbi:hypothetical protein VFPFJ_03821 [Purpureocillium lilacinum]|uniref:Uncharacterized protein n=1 Tax=Purpureocillium lilacinum TaxID=33203 RepID=A0A179HR97_PURLI|nr:hypothetical protein VFPFJ_03821 [Purpureocillium lilacinum]OAQ92081.1 hypothetical protein VFPFJ_03821 [Purpureocillium lilacinum]